MRITVTYTTQLKAAVGVASEDVEVPDGSYLSALLRTLSDRYPDTFARLALDERGNVAPSVLVCVDDEQIRTDEDVLLAADNHVTFLSAISGG